MSSSNTEQPTQGTTESSSWCGRVKWFNNKAGYGFITASDGDRAGEDVFVHHSALVTTEEQYKYLVQGEYVQFQWSQTEDDSSHKWQATDVRGVNGGKLMCETRNETRSTRAPRSDSSQRRRPRRELGDMRDARGSEWESRGNSNRYRGGGPRTVQDEDGVEWMLVRKNARQGNSNRRQNRSRSHDEEA